MYRTLESMFAALRPFVLSVIGAQVALVLLSLLPSLLSFRVDALQRSIFPVNLFRRGFHCLPRDRKTWQRPVVSARLRGGVCCLAGRLLLPTPLGRYKTEEGPTSVRVLDYIIYWQLSEKLNRLLFSLVLSPLVLGNCVRNT